MSKSAASAIPGVDVMNDTLEFVKNMWSSVRIPGMVTPTVKVDDINKQIADLKAVESWLTLNMNMLRSTIQALEVQSATIAALQSMGETVSAIVKPNGAGKSAGASFTPHPVTSVGRAEEGATLQGMGREPTFSFDPPTADKPPAPATASEPRPEPQAAAQAEPMAAPVANAAMMAAPFANPAAWWNMLQDQFKQAVHSAVAEEPQGNDKAGESRAAANGKESGRKSGNGKAGAGKTAGGKTTNGKTTNGKTTSGKTTSGKTTSGKTAGRGKTAAAKTRARAPARAASAAKKAGSGRRKTAA